MSELLINDWTGDWLWRPPKINGVNDRFQIRDGLSVSGTSLRSWRFLFASALTSGEAAREKEREWGSQTKPPVTQAMLTDTPCSYTALNNSNLLSYEVSCSKLCFQFETDPKNAGYIGWFGSLLFQMLDY